MIALGRYLMGTRFELVLCGGGDAARLRAAGEAALDEIERLEALLSIYRPDSDVSQVNAYAAERWVRVHPNVFTLLARAMELNVASGGAFDITLLPLLRAWGFIGDTGHYADTSDVDAARALIGPHHVMLDPDSSSVRFDRPGVGLDLGAIGKGFALDAGADLLRETGITAALLHGGTSTVLAIGTPEDSDAWKIAIRDPQSDDGIVSSIALLDGRALSVSAVHGKSFVAPDGRLLGHVLDPRTGEPIAGERLAATVTEKATDADALSTALLVLGETGARSTTGFSALLSGPSFVVAGESGAPHHISGTCVPLN